MKKFATLRTKLRSLLLILVLATGQVATATGPFINLGTAKAAQTCFEDTAGPNDEPGQKDLTNLCVNDAGLPASLAVTWNWDDTSWSGNNSGDACSLYDTDGDGNANFSLCEIVKGDSATHFSTALYTCAADSRTDRCGGPVEDTTFTSSCTASVVAGSQPFATGSDSPDDTVAVCNINLADVGAANAELIDVCSYPSQQPNSDPSDCVILQDNSGKLQVVKDLIPSNNSGLFNLQVNGATEAPNVGDGGMTGEVVVDVGDNTVGETAGTNTSLASYSSSISCRDLNGSGAVVSSGPGTSLARVPVADGADVVCIITNIAAGSITITKDALPNSLADFAFTATGTGVSNFSLDDDTGVGGADATLSNTKLFSNLSAGAYTFTEAQLAGWDLTSLSCTGGVSVVSNLANRTVTVNLASGENVTCNFTNTKRGHLIVQKTTNPAGDPTQFSINAEGTGTVIGGGAGTISDATDKDYEVTPGTYSVTETVPGGWAKTGDTCQGVVVAPGAIVTCLITNTKYGTLVIIKNALPNDSQDFAFSTTNLSGALFNLDDDADATLSNTQTFSNLLPGAYSVTEATTPHWSMTGLSCDTPNFQTVGGTVSVSLAAGQTTTCTYENTKLGSISGTKFIVNADGSLTANQTAALGWTVNLILGGNVVQTTQTDANGDYSFSDLLIGLPYSVAEVLTAGWTQITTSDTCTNDSPITLTAGQTSTDNDFCNFQNGSIGGYKWNDKNGNGTKQEDEPKLAGWTITLKDGANQQVGSSVVTDVNGNYNFTNLAPGSYSVCESPQANWVQTYPANNGCHYFNIDQSGESNSANFGNQGRGNITVIKNVDTDGDGDVDTAGATDWTWDITNGAQNTATGSSQNVAADTYTVSEDQKPNFHVVSVVCDTQVSTVSESVNVTVAPGTNVTCTFTNARNRGSLTVVKHVINDDGGKAVAADFNMHVKKDGADVANSPAAGSETGTSYSLITGTYVVSEDAPVAGYEQTSIVCNGQETDTVVLGNEDKVTCTITNDDIAPTLTLVKQVVNDNSGTMSANDWALTADPAEGDNISGVGSVTSDAVANTPYKLTELGPSGYYVDNDWSCDVGIFDSVTNKVTLGLDQDATCMIVNNDDAHPSIHLEKDGPTYANPGETVTYTFSVENTGDEPLSNVEIKDPMLDSANYVSGDTNENDILDVVETWLFTTDYEIPVDQDSNILNTAEVCADPRDGNEVCDEDEHTIVIYGKVVVTKYNDYNRNGSHDEGEPVIPDWKFTLSGSDECDLQLSELLSEILDHECLDYSYLKTQTTGQDGTTIFTDVKPYTAHELSETLPEGWHLSDVDCDQYEVIYRVPVQSQEGSLSVEPGDTVNCFVGNYHDVVLNLSKTNNRPDATVVGDTVTYTLTASLDEQSGALFGTTVTDLPPEGFTYVPGSWTAVSNLRGDLKAANITTEPTYGSPGTWFLGDMLPGEIVTLTYRTLIASSVSDGIYPDVAFAQGCGLPVGEGCSDEEVVLSNLHEVDEPFVATQVTVRSPQVLGATILVNTGSSINIAYAVTALSLMLIGAITMKRREFQKGGAK